MPDSFIRLPADSTGKQLDTTIVNMGVGTTEVHREKVVLSDPASTTGFATVTSSAGVLASLSSGTVSLSSQITVTATGPVTVSGTVTVLSASSGLVQISGIPAVTSTSVVLSSAGLTQISGTVTVLNASSGLVQISGVPTVTATAGTNPWSSAPGFNVPAVTASSGLVQISGTPLVAVTSSAAIAPTTIIATTVSGISAAAGVLYRLEGFTTAPTGAVIRLYNAATGAVVMGSAIVAYILAGAQSTIGTQTQTDAFTGVRGMNFPTACSFDVVTDALSTVATATQTFVTFQYV